jgi:nicotinate-nucleotide adenylyltransferase
MPSPEHGGNWGLLGGAFDPVHRGHLALAEDILEAMKLDGVLFVPSFNPPRKQASCVASFDDRVTMIGLAIAGLKEFQLCEIERESNRPGYSLLTVRAVKRRYPDANLRFIVGADLLSELHGWYEADSLVKEIHIVAGLRPGSAARVPDELSHAGIEIVPTRLVEAASRDIRARIANGDSVESLSTFVPQPVAEYIAERKLYR